MKHIIRFAALFLAGCLLAGCVMMPTIPPNPGNPIKSVAVLPLVNQTNDVDAPQFVRQRLSAALAQRHYCVMPEAEVDLRLRDQLGITLGGQLAEATVEQLVKVLRVDGLIFGNLMDFNEITTGAYNVKKVRCRFQMISTAQGEIVWQNGIGVKSEYMMDGKTGAVATVAAAISDHKDGEEVPWVLLETIVSEEDYGTTLGIALGTKLLSQAFGTQLLRETDEMIKRVLETLPVGPGVTVSFEEPAPADAPRR